MPVNGRRPISEIIEAAQFELVRESAADQEGKYLGFANQVYLNDLATVLPERYIKKEAFIVTQADYTVGTVTVGTGTAGVIGLGTTWTSANTNNWLRVSNGSEMFRVTYTAATGVTYNNSLTWTGSSGSGLSYILFQDRYSLASDFAYMVEDQENIPQVVYKWINKAKIFLTPWDDSKFDQNTNGVIGQLYAYNVEWESETPYLRVISGPDAAENLGYSYIPELTTLSEYTTAYVSLSNSTAVTATEGVTTWSVSITTGTNTYYFRNDADGTGSSSVWYKVKSVEDASSLTLDSTFAGASAGDQEYTIAEISKWPARFDDAILYRTAALVDPDCVQAEKWLGFYNNAVGLDLSVESKRRLSQRVKRMNGLRKNGVR